MFNWLEVSIPYPTTELMLCWLIVAMLVNTWLTIRAGFVKRRNPFVGQPWAFPFTVIICMVFPWVVYEVFWGRKEF